MARSQSKAGQGCRKLNTIRGRMVRHRINQNADKTICQVIGFLGGSIESDTKAEVKRFFETHPEFPRNKKGEITRQRATGILTQPLYTGFICSENYGLDWIKGQHEPLISLETFDKVQERRKGISTTPARKNIGNDFTLRGFILCGYCGTPLRSSWSTGKTKRYR